jgi:hypothetical protein
LRQEVWSRQTAVLEELAVFEEQNPSLPISSGIACCRKALENIRTIFDPEAHLSADEPDPRHLLYADLLHLDALPLNDQWEPEADSQAMVESLLALIAREQGEWWRTFNGHCERRDHETTARILEYLAANPEGASRIEEFRQVREKHISECQAALRRDVEETRKHVENAVAFGLLREQERDDFVADIDGIEMAIDYTLRFFERHAQLSTIRKAILAKRNVEVDGVRQRLESVQIGSEHPAYARIHTALDTGDVLTANEYIDMALGHLPLPEIEPQATIFDEFFPQTLRAIANFMEPPHPAERPDPLRIVNEVRSYAKGHRRTYAIGPVNMYRVEGNQAAQAADMLEAWFTAKKTQRLDEARARIVLTAFGLNPVQVAINRSARHRWIDVVSDPIHDRNRCPVPAYGYSANGRYRILCVWDRPTEEDLLNDIGEASHGSPTFVFHFGCMTEQRRRTFLVIDDAVVLYLCGEPGSRLPVLFECTLPFTFLEPYTTTAGLVPPEMFYGRARERDSIIDPMGSCFIYGGRQLGKTALLRDVERRFYAPQEGRVARWLDLKAEGIGYDRPIEEIWHLLSKELKRVGVLPANLPDHTGVDRLLEHIQSWLGEDERRRILLLLDEADRFLESDGKGKEGFVHCARIKGWMDRTERRFKVVFAGLHNVQRTAGQENHPLAHYGEPICIGPLLDHGEWREARALLEHPFASIGYRFESSDLVTRILSQTNYYPNLIQLYCNQLLRHIHNPHQVVFDPKISPPYMITSRHVEEAYDSQDLRKAIRDRLMWTLQLDQRYEVIAYSIAYSSISGRERGRVDGFPVPWIREEALTWWKAGFRSDTSEEYFRALLDEMVGLGILRVVDVDRYALRSPNVISLMGTEGEIEARLSGDREAPLEYEPAAFRAAFRVANHVDASRRSPLTARQESELRGRNKNGISVIVGCTASGIEELPHFLISTFGDEFFIQLEDVFDRTGFAERRNVLSGRERDGTTLLLVSPTCPWSELWINEAAQKLRNLTSKRSFVHVAFVADPETAWQWIGQHPTRADLSPLIISLKPWHDAALRQWLDDCSLPSDKSSRERITHVTGNWPIQLQRFYQGSKADPHHWERYLEELAVALRDPKMAADIARDLGLTLHELCKILRDLVTLGEASVEDLAGIIEDVSGEVVQHSLRWAELLSLVTPVGYSSWHVNPLVARILETVGE